MPEAGQLEEEGLVPLLDDVKGSRKSKRYAPKLTVVLVKLPDDYLSYTTFRNI